MLQRSEVVEGIYLKQTKERYGLRAGLIAVVHKVGIDSASEWIFQLKYLNSPAGTRTRPVSQWSLNLRERDLEDFELIGDWRAAQAVLESTARPDSKPNKQLQHPSKHDRVPLLQRHGLRKWNPNQLWLFEDF